jgi:hypothetical protein
MMRKLHLVMIAVLATLILSAASSSAKVKVYIVAGQSNAVGHASRAYLLPEKLKAPQMNVMFWYEEGPSDSVNNPLKRIASEGWEPLMYQTDPDHHTFGNFLSGFGPEIKLGKVLSNATLDDTAIIKFGINATTLANAWNASAPGVLYTDMMDVIDEALFELGNLGLHAELAGFFFMHGEWDAISTADAAAYENNLTDFIQHVRTDLNTPDLPFIIGRVNKWIFLSPFGISQANVDLVRQAQEAVAGNDAFATLCDTDDLEVNFEFVHFTAAGEVLLGHLFAVAYLGLVESYPVNLTDVDTLDVKPFDRVNHTVTGKPGSFYMVLGSLGRGPTNTPWGVVGLDPPVYFLWAGTIGAFGYDTMPIVIPYTGLGFFYAYSQTLVDNNPPVWAIGGNNHNGLGGCVWALY